MILTDIDITDLPLYYRQGKGKEHMKRVLEPIDKYCLYANNAIEKENKVVEQGDEGEKRTEGWYKERGYKVIRNLYLPYSNGFTQIDLVAYKEETKEVIVVEVKNWNTANSYISDYKEDKWVVDYDASKCVQYNPIKQHRSHMYVLSGVESLKPYVKNFKYEVDIWVKDEVNRLNVRVYDDLTNIPKKSALCDTDMQFIVKTLEAYASNSSTIHTLHLLTLTRRMNKKTGKLTVELKNKPNKAKKDYKGKKEVEKIKTEVAKGNNFTFAEIMKG